MSFDVVVTSLGPRAASLPALLEELLGFGPQRARALGSSLPVVVVARTTRAHADIAAGMLRETGATVDVVAHGAAPLSGSKAKDRPRAAAREVCDTRVESIASFIPY